MRRVLITGGSGFVGTNAVEHYVRKGIPVLSLDRLPPPCESHRPYWKQVDLLDVENFASAIEAFAPTDVIHFAARTDLDHSAPLDAYRVNTDGVANLLRALANVPSARRAFFASSMLVCRLGYRPSSDTDFQPDTTYGQSKAIGETLVRKSSLPGLTWVIGRLTSIWGPWFGEPYRRFFELVAKGLYVNPSRSAANKTFGYVENTLHQIECLLTAAPAAVHGRTFYLGDVPALDISAWADEVASEFGRATPRRAPLALLKAAARIGDLASIGGFRFPMTSFRLRNMTTDNVVDLESITSVAGPGPISSREGIRRTVRWLQDQRANRGLR